MKEIKWNAKEIEMLRKGHVYNDMTDEVQTAAERLAVDNAVDVWTAKIIVVMLMNCGVYTAIRITNTRIEFKVGSGSADVLNENCVITAYAGGIKAFRVGIENYVNNLVGYLR